MALFYNRLKLYSTSSPFSRLLNSLLCKNQKYHAVWYIRLKNKCKYTPLKQENLANLNPCHITTVCIHPLICRRTPLIFRIYTLVRYYLETRLYNVEDRVAHGAIRLSRKLDGRSPT
jgi:hypothetical protein